MLTVDGRRGHSGGLPRRDGGAVLCKPLSKQHVWGTGQRMGEATRTLGSRAHPDKTPGCALGLARGDWPLDLPRNGVTTRWRLFFLYVNLFP